jgi:hypothetical protein
MMLPVATSRRRSAHTARLQSVKQRSKSGSKGAERRRLMGEAQLASAG